MTEATRKDEPRGAGPRAAAERRLDCCGMTHIGRRRNTNEDQFLVAELERRLEVRQSGNPELVQTTSRRQGQLLVVADGMGGHAGGGIASEVAIRTIAEHALGALPWLDARARLSEIREGLAQSLQGCQTRLEHTEGPPRMGTTVTLALVVWPHAHIAHVGDSRCYLFRQGSLEQLTRDHTLAQRLVEDRLLPPEDVHASPLKDVLWNAVGGGSPELAPELKTVELMKGDSLMLCTDGLTKHVNDRTIAMMLAETTNASPTCERLIEAANAAGGTDNITVIVARY